MTKTEILNLGDLKHIDVVLELSLRDFEGNIYTSKKESFAINDSATKELPVHIPADAEPGRYMIHGRVNYQEIEAISYDDFTVVETTLGNQIARIISYIMIGSTLILLIIALIRSLIKQAEKRRREDR